MLSKNNDDLSKLPPNLKQDNNINSNKNRDSYIKQNNNIDCSIINKSQEKIIAIENSTNNNININLDAKLNKKLTPTINKKPTINSILNTNQDVMNFDLKNINDINKKYTLFEDVALEKIYDDIQYDLKNNFTSEKPISSNINNLNNPGIVYAKRKTKESNRHLSVKEFKDNPKLCKELDKNVSNNKPNNNDFGINHKISINNPTNQKNYSLNNKKTVKEEDLFLSMTKRLNLVEMQLKENKTLLDKKTEENKKLYKKIEELQYNSAGKNVLKNFHNLEYNQKIEERIDEELMISKESFANNTYEDNTRSDLYSAKKSKSFCFLLKIIFT